jgi:aspartate/methionine/tyrosine aminotransferase
MTAELTARVRHLGTETAFDVLAKAAKLAQAGRDIINLGIGQPDFPTPQHVVEAAIKAARDGHHGYTPANGILPLREAVVRDIKKYRNIEVSPDDVVILPGAKPALFFAAVMFGEHGGEILYPDPGFPIYASAVAFSGATPVPFTLKEKNGFAFRADDVLAAITPRTRLIILNSPSNPTGGVSKPAELRRLVDGLAKHPNVAILSDEVYARLVFDGEENHSLIAFPEIRDRLLLLDGWSKTYAMTGWRLGWCHGPKAWIDRMTRLAINVYSCPNAITQHAGIAALEGPQDAVEHMRQAFERRRDLIVKRVNATSGLSCVRPGGAFYLFPNITGTVMKSAALQDALLEQAGVAAVAGTSFGAAGEGFLRFSYANSDENIEKAMDRVGELLAKRRKS